jgi:hypothetical protein
MLAVKKGDDEIDRRGQKEGGLTDILGILKADQRLARHLDRKDIYISKLREIHRSPNNENPGKKDLSNSKLDVQMLELENFHPTF